MTEKQVRAFLHSMIDKWVTHLYSKGYEPLTKIEVIIDLQDHLVNVQITDDWFKGGI